MPDLDKMSQTIGEIQGTLKSVKEGQDKLWDKVDKIDTQLTSHRLKVAGMAGLVSGAITAVYHLFKGN